MSLGKVLVTGGTGRIGREVIARLSQGGQCSAIVATSHNPDKASYLKDLGATQLLNFDYSDDSNWKEVLSDVNVVFSSSPDNVIEGHMKFAALMGETSSVKHCIRISCFGADEKVTSSNNKDKHVTRANAAIPLMLQHYWWSEECLHDAGVPTTVLRGNFFMNHLLKNEQENIKNGFFESPLGDCRNSFVAANDMAEAAVVCMMEGPERHANKFYDITGPEPQSMYEVAEDLGAAMGKTIEYRAQDMVQFEKDFGPTRAEFFEYLNNGFYTRTSPCFYNLTGRKPTSYADYLVNKGAAGETGLEELFQAGMYVKGEDKFAHLKNVSKL
jgi:uncharacterized protein YbjT (DUF2867 family)